MNSENDITQLYNSLFQLEAKFKKNAVYPIHKKLHFEEYFADIYDYLVTKINVSGKEILDAGCGVGFGSVIFIKNGAKKVTGISVSDKEIKRANEIKSELKIENCFFEKATFDEVSHLYDIVFCVESLKHSLDFNKSFSILLKSLNENGKLVIVDDFFDGNDNSISNDLMKNWHLNFLLSENDLIVDKAIFSVEIEDLTRFIKLKSLLKIYFQLCFFTIFKRNSPYKKLFKGGIQLDYLYSRKQMNYKLIVITKNK